MENFGVIKIKKITNAEMLFYIAYIFIFVSSFYSTTTFIGIYNPTRLKLIIRMGAAILIGVKLIFYDRYNFRQLIIIALFILFGVISWINSDRTALLDFILIFVGCKGIDKKQFVKLYFYMGLILLSITMTCSLTGVIENYITYRSGSNIMRYSFGIIYSTDFAAHVFFLDLAYHYIRKHRLNFFDIIIQFGIAVFLDRFCDARLSVSMIVITLFIFLLYDYKTVIFKSKFVKWTTTFITFICGLFSIFITNAYSASDPFMVGLNKNLFSSRLSIGKRVIDYYGFSLFGQSFRTQGQGYSLLDKDNELGMTFLDSSYVQIIMLYGIILFLIIMIFYTIAANRVWKREDLRLAVIIILIAVDCIWNQFLIHMAYNPFIIVIGMYLLDSGQKALKQNENITT